MACRIRHEACVCAHAPRLSLATRVVLIVHAIEWNKPSNTGHLARLALRDADIRLHGRPNRIVSDEGVDPRSSLVLFPGHGAAVLTREAIDQLPRPITLLVPDGNWNQARHMMARVPMLRQARPVRLDGPTTLGVRILRRNVGDRRSTFEAIAQTLALIEGAEVGDQMIEFFQRVLDSKNER